jgi:GTP pyrophosphokinase
MARPGNALATRCQTQYNGDVKSKTDYRLSQRFEQALLLATRLHDGQYRKDTIVPYIAHPLAVAALVLEYGGNEDEAIAALLHDTIEDQGHRITLEEIHQRFGETVAAIVIGCSDATSVPKPPWRKRKEAYVAHLKQAPASERLVSAADKLHNARSILADYRALGESVWDRFTGGKEGTRWYYRVLVETFRSFGTNPLVEELERVVSEIERLTARDLPESSELSGR